METSAVRDHVWVTGNDISFPNANAALEEQSSRDVGVFCKSIEILNTNRWHWNASVASVL